MPPRLPTLPAAARRTAAALVLTLACAAPAAAVTLPPDFVLETVPFVFDVPTDIAFLPDGRLLVAEKGGILYVVDGATRHSMWVHEEEVLNAGDRGFLSVAVDPQFDQNRFLYFLVTVDPDSDGVELNNHNDTFARLLRYQVSASNPNVVDAGSRTVLLGATWRQGFAVGSESHTIGDLAWGRDGTLLVSAGDGAHFESVDPGGLDPGLFGPTRTDPLEDVGAFRSQMLDSKGGKILRIDPSTGLGLPSNPYWNGDPASNRSRVWAYGLRNPFRIAVRPGTGSIDPADGDPGTIYVGDVGWMTWEEVNVVRAPGVNFGWPCFEGMLAHPDYHAATPARAGCSTLDTPGNPALPTAPLIAVHHDSAGSSTPPGHQGYTMIGGVFADGAHYPHPYTGNYFVGDYAADWIKVLETDPNDQLVSVHEFATEADGPVAFTTDPATGDLLYVAIYTGRVHRIRYTGVVSAGPPAPPSRLALGVPRPNPARGSAAFALELPASAAVALTIIDVGGREVWRAPARDFPAGRSTVLWPGITRGGTPASAGVYVAVAEAGDQRVLRRFVMLR
jgi:glucose/arabinose dehydrogenase